MRDAERHFGAFRREGNCFPDRPRFMGYAARVMRGLIIDHARSRNAIKRGGEFEITSLETDPGENPVDAKELSSISDALDQLAKVEPKLAELVDMKFFCGFSFAEIAALENLVGTYRTEKVGKGANLSPSEYSRGFTTLRN
jgi:DNA-directed RNA polymerase specialized sigma24 family protein